MPWKGPFDPNSFRLQNVLFNLKKWLMFEEKTKFGNLKLFNERKPETPTVVSLSKSSILCVYQKKIMGTWCQLQT